jgi:hypothetical protein
MPSSMQSSVRSNVRSPMLSHAQHILGAEIVFMLDACHKQYIQMHNVARVEFSKKTSSDNSSKLPAMLFPRGSEMYYLYVDTSGHTFVRTSSHDSVFFLQQQWTHLQHIIHNDSIVLAIVYRNKQEQLVMGIYDILRASGVEYDGYNIFDRQKHLFQLFAQQTPDNFCESITAHWVGEEASLVQYMRDSAFLQTLPFEIDNMLRINQTTGKHLQYTLLLRPLLIPALIDMHDDCALRPCKDL